MYRRKRKIDYWYASSILKNSIPELKNVDSEMMKHYLMTTKPQMEFYEVAVKPVKFWLRLTFPLAFILLLLMFVSIPFKFILTGKWLYEYNGIYNWFKALHLTR